MLLIGPRAPLAGFMPFATAVAMKRYAAGDGVTPWYLPTLTERG
jgi:hypothetical protein